MANKLTPRILIIDDDSQISAALYRGLSTVYSVDISATGSAALRKLETAHYAAVVLDLHLPDMPGLVVCQKIRANDNRIPILVVTGDNAVTNKISLLDAGADDYITKPLQLAELKARLRALLRRNKAAGGSRGILQVGDLQMDTQSHEVRRAGKVISLRRKEYALLECLLLHSDSVVTRDILLDYAWDGNHAIWTNSIDVHIKYLRDKVDRPFPTPIIKTIYGLGYKLDASPNEAPVT